MERTHCTACKGPYHESTGHILSEKSQLCGPCALDFRKWVSGQTKRKWGGVRFYDHTFTSANKTKE